MTDVQVIMETIREQLMRVASSDPDFYGKHNIVLSNEQQFVKPQDRGKNKIYVVVKILPASVNFGQRIVPITINAVSERNKIEVCQRLLNEFSIEYNLKMGSLEDEDDSSIIHYTTQTYTTPAVSGNFNEVMDGYRSLFYMSGTFLISENANVFSLSYVKDEEESKVETITSSFSIDVQNDVQATYDSNDFTRSSPMIATMTIGFTGYFVSDGIMLDILSIAKNKSLNQKFNLKLTFRDGTEISGDFRLVNMSVQQNVGEMPVASITMTE